MPTATIHPMYCSKSSSQPPDPGTTSKEQNQINIEEKIPIKNWGGERGEGMWRVLLTNLCIHISVLSWDPWIVASWRWERRRHCRVADEVVPSNLCWWQRWRLRWSIGSRICISWIPAHRQTRSLWHRPDCCLWRLLKVVRAMWYSDLFFKNNIK